MDNVKSLAWATDPALKEFGLQISANPIETTARILDSPSVSYGQAKTIKPRDGKWSMGPNKFLEAPVIRCWGILKFDLNADVRPFVTEMVATGLRCGIKFKDANAQDPLVRAVDNQGALENAIKDFYLATGNKCAARPDIIFIILPSRNKPVDLYGNIKKVCDTIIGTVSQCIDGFKLRKVNKQYCVRISNTDFVFADRRRKMCGSRSTQR